MRLPNWLDNYIFKTLGAKYCPVHSDMTVIDWNKEQIRGYLGTYFPRSYAESYTIFSRYLANSQKLTEQTDISVLDFGSGTGGELFGLLKALEDKRPNISRVRIRVIEGNADSLRSYERILSEMRNHTTIQVICSPSPIKIDDFYDLGILDSLFTESFDIIISFKAVCEFVTKKQFETQNPYQHLAGFMLPKLSGTGIMVLADISSRNEISNEWIPDMMDRGLNNLKANVTQRNIGYNESFSVCHSGCNADGSKLAWRIIEPLK